DDERRRFMAAQDPGGECPCHLEFRDVLGGDLVEPTEACAGIVLRRHHPLTVILHEVGDLARLDLSTSDRRSQRRLAAIVVARAEKPGAHEDADGNRYPLDRVEVHWRFPVESSAGGGG